MNSEFPREFKTAERAALLNLARARLTRTGKKSKQISRADRSASLPLSYAQQRLWFIDRLRDGKSREYHIPSALRLLGVLDRSALRRALDKLVERHEVLRTVFVEGANGEAVQVIADGRGFALQEVELGQYDEQEREEQVRWHARAEFAAAFDLRVGPPIRGRLLCLSAEEYVLLITMHHIVSDGWSLGILLRELSKLYIAYQHGRSDPLSPLGIQYADYAVWERGWLQGDVLQEKVGYWKKQLDGAPVLELPLDRPRPAKRSHVGSMQRIDLGKELTQGVMEVARAADATLYMTMLAMFQVLLWRWSGQEDVVVATPMAGRSRPETEALIGFFVNMLLMRVRVESGVTFRELLSRVKQAALGAYAHEELPFDELVAQIQSERAGLSAAALARVAFTLQNASTGGRLDFGGLKLEPLIATDGEGGGRVVKNDLLFTVQESSQGLQGYFEYATELFDASSIETVSRRWVKLVEQVVAHPDRRLAEIDLQVPMRNERRENRHRLSSTQQVMWVDLQVHPQKASYYNIVDYVEIFGRVDERVFELALQRVVASTAALRLRFAVVGKGFLEQEILSERRIELHVEDFSRLRDASQAAQRWMDERRRRHIDPLCEVPFAYALLKVDEDRFYWYAHYHHLIMDGVGLLLVKQKVAQIYSALLRGEDAELQSDDEAYVRYLHADAEYRYTSTYQKDRAYWRGSCRKVEAVSLVVHTTAKPAGEPLKIRGAVKGEVSSALKRLARREQLSFSRLMIAAFALYVHKMSGRSEVSLGLPTHGRFEESCRQLVAACTNISPVQCVIDGGLRITEVVTGIVQDLQQALEHGRFGYEEVRRLLDIRVQDAPLFNISVNALSNLDEMTFADCKGETRSFARYENDLIVWILFGRAHDELEIAFYGNPHLYERWELERHLDRFRYFLEGLSTAIEKDLKVSQLGVLSPLERRGVLQDFNATSRSYERGRLLHELFEERVESSVEAIALVFGEERLSYGQLNERANQLAHYLRGKCVRPDELVGICVERSIEMVVGILAVLKAGGAYVPLDPGYPSERLEYMVRDASPRVIVTQLKHRTKLVTGAWDVVELDGQWEEIAQYPRSNPDKAIVGLQLGHLAYVIYTSGSTGRPKGAGVEHGGMLNLLQWYVEEFGFRESDRTLIVSSFSFDLTQKNFFAALLVGGQVHLANEPFDPPGIVQQISKQGISTLNLTPSAFYAIAEADDQAGKMLGSVRYVFLGGEPINLGRVKGLQRYEGMELINSYGPTECSDVVSFYRLPSPWLREAVSELIPIGRPIANTRIYILDSAAEPVAIGMAGEICIAGVGVGRGYLNQEALTAERFVRDPFGLEPGSRIYKTGDVGRWRADGTIEYLGRNDHQVKIRGYRIELGEIESRMREYPQIKEAVVVVQADGGGEGRLVGYYTMHHHEVMESSDSLRMHLRRLLPEYMVPSVLVEVAKMPLTPNGKVDRLGFPAANAAATRAYEPPQGETEKLLAQIWCELLHVPRVGRNDNFFDLGGHSLLILGLQDRVLRAGYAVEVSQLIEHSILHAQAKSLLRGVHSARDIVKIRAEGNQPPLFVVHETSGEVLPYLALSQLLPNDLPIFGLCATNFSDEELGSVQRLATVHIKAMRSVQPSGPYRVCGYSFGGLLAYEIAHQLISSGDSVQFIGLIDTMLNSTRKTYKYDHDAANERGKISLLYAFIQQRTGLTPWQILERLDHPMTLATAVDQCRNAGLLAIDETVESLKQPLESMRPILQMQQETIRFELHLEKIASIYEVPLLPVITHFFAAKKLTRRNVGAVELMEEGRLRVSEIGGDHWSIMRPPFVERLAVTISQIIERQP